MAVEVVLQEEFNCNVHFRDALSHQKKPADLTVTLTMQAADAESFAANLRLQKSNKADSTAKLPLTVRQ